MVSRSNTEALGAAVLSFVVHDDLLYGEVTPCKTCNSAKIQKTIKGVRFNEGGFLLYVVAICQPTIKSKGH